MEGSRAFCHSRLPFFSPLLSSPLWHDSLLVCCPGSLWMAVTEQAAHEWPQPYWQCLRQGPDPMSLVQTHTHTLTYGRVRARHIVGRCYPAGRIGAELLWAIFSSLRVSTVFDWIFLFYFVFLDSVSLPAHSVAVSFFLVICGYANIVLWWDYVNGKMVYVIGSSRSCSDQYPWGTNNSLEDGDEMSLWCTQWWSSSGILLCL